MKTLLFCLFCFITATCFSQEADSGYIIKNNHDTLWGKFKDDMMSKKVKIYINGKLEKFDVTELIGYKKGNEINRRFSNDLYMATLETQGKINIWAIHTAGPYAFDQYFLEKNEQSIEVNGKAFKTTIPEWIKDYGCNSEIMSEKLNRSNFKKVIIEYNTCNQKGTTLK